MKYFKLIRTGFFLYLAFLVVFFATVTPNPVKADGIKTGTYGPLCANGAQYNIETATTFNTLGLDWLYAQYDSGFDTPDPSVIAALKDAGKRIILRTYFWNLVSDNWTTMRANPPEYTTAYNEIVSQINDFGLANLYGITISEEEPSLAYSYFSTSPFTATQADDWAFGNNTLYAMIKATFPTLKIIGTGHLLSMLSDAQFNAANMDGMMCYNYIGTSNLQSYLSRGKTLALARGIPMDDVFTLIYGGMDAGYGVTNNITTLQDSFEMAYTLGYTNIGFFSDNAMNSGAPNMENVLFNDYGATSTAGLHKQAMIDLIEQYTTTEITNPPAPPDINPTLERLNIYHNLLETDDVLLVWVHNIPYTTLPTYKVGDAYTWQLLDTDDTTVLGYVTGYAYHEDGYGYNVYSMYFSAADGYVWGTAYKLKLVGNPAVFSSPPTYTYTINAASYTGLTDSDENKAALAEEVLYLAGYLNQKWSLPSDDRLTLETEVGTVLSIEGENFFRGAINGLQGMAPAAFRFAVSDTLGIVDRSWNTTYVTALEGQYAGTWVETARNASRNFMGTGSYDLMGMGLLLMAGVGVVIANVVTTTDHWAGLIDVGFMLVVASRLDIFPLVYLVLIMVLCFLYIGMRLWKMIPQ
jgi:hypothetical protein